MYNIILYIYQLGVFVLSLFNEKVRKMWRGECDAIRVIKEKIDPEAKYVWFHAASLGEFEQGRPLMEQLRQEHPEYKILLTFFSPSGYEVRKDYDGADIICYLPLDTVTNARRFLRTIRPVMAFFIKYEFWYNYLHILRHRGVPVYSVSSIFRPGQIFFRWYGWQYAHVLRCFTRFYVQNEVSRDLLGKIGITDVSIVGDTRFDRVLQIKAAAKQLPVVEQFLGREGFEEGRRTKEEEREGFEEGGRTKEERREGFEEGREGFEEGGRTKEEGEYYKPKVFVAGSSWQPDEEIFIPWLKEHPDWKLIIAPHVISDDHLRQIERMLEGHQVVRYSQLAKLNSQPSTHNPNFSTLNSTTPYDALIIDCFGLLSSIYRYADVTYVGGGFGVGIHNTLEAAVWGVPVIFGPNNERFREAQGLKACGGGQEIGGSDDFCRIMQDYTDHPSLIREHGIQAGAYVKQMTGATAKILSDVSL